MKENLELKLANLPESPGCYLMKQNGRIIYIGKAKNLKNRVKSYFTSKAHSLKTLALVSKIDDIDFVLCQSEIEAFLLENNLIKLHRPYYNIRLKDDKNYPYLRLDTKEAFPRLTVARRALKDGARYFGPYISAYALRQILDLIRRLYPIRSCRLKLPLKNPIRPCLQYEIGRCKAPCANLISEKDYMAIMDELSLFLKGDTQRATDSLQEKMKKASSELNFEKAKEYYDTINDIRSLFTNRAVENASSEDMDIFALFCDIKDAMLSVIMVRQGKLIANRNYVLEDEGGQDKSELLSSVISAYYSESVPPKEVVSEDFEGSEAYFEYLSDKHGRKISHAKGLRGRKRQLLDMAKKNAAEALKQRSLKKQLAFEREELAMQDLMDILGFDKNLKRLEAFDISNTQGTNSVASMTVMVNGKLEKKEYRHFNIKTVVGANDFESMYEVISRRLKRSLEEDEKKRWVLPDVILIDGGKQQLKFAKKAMDDVGLNIPVFSLAERMEEIFLLDREESIVLDRKSRALHLIIRLRDEAHRFAISHHRVLRGKSMIKSSLEQIEGIGKERRRRLLLKFGSIKNMQDKTIEDFLQVEGMNKKAAENLFNALNARK